MCVGEVCEDQWCLCAYGHQTLQTACSYRGTTDGVVNSEYIILFFIIKLMQYKDTSQQAFFIIYLICIL